MIVIAASAASIGAQVNEESISATSKSRRKTPNAAALVATAMKAVTGVGAPWYTSGVHWWNGATEALKQSPTTQSPMPVSISTSELRSPEEFAAAIPLKSVEPVAP